MKKIGYSTILEKKEIKRGFTTRRLLPLLGIMILVVSSEARPVLATSSVVRDLRKIATDLEQNYRSRTPETTKQIALAVFPFHASENIEQKNIGFAVSELLMRNFVQSRSFVVVERTMLNKIMEEQKLHLTGAVDSETAVRVGHLVGAKALLMGDVEKLKDKYHVTARLVDVESGQVMAVGYGELEATLFEEEAKPYLVMVPREQAIGVYLFYNFRNNANNLPVATSQLGGQSITSKPVPFYMSLFGLGLKYFPRENLALDFAGGFLSNKPTIASFSGPAVNFADIQALSLTGGYLARGTVMWVKPWTPYISSYLGGGIDYYRLRAGQTEADFNYSSTNPLVRAGLEFRPQERIGLSFYLNYDLGKHTGANSSLGGINMIDINALSFEPTVGVYF